MHSRSTRLALFTVLILGCFAIATAPRVASAAPPPGLALWAPGDPDPTIPFSNRSPVAIVARTRADARAVVATGIDVEDVRPTGDGRWLVRANVDDAERAAIERFDREIYSLRNLSHEARMRDRGWPTWDEYVAQMQQIAASHPNICRLVSIGRSVQGRDLWFMKISRNPDVEEDEPEFKYSSSMHGDEVTGMQMCMRLINLLTDSYGIDPTLTSYVDNMEIWICPHANPDGYAAGTRYNAHGVDLNRNYPDPVTDPHDDPTGREPETQLFMYFGYAHRFILSANYHGGALVVNYPWDCQQAYTPDNQMILDWSLGYSYRNSPMWNSPYFTHGVTIGWAWYIVNGGMQDWCYNWRSDIDVTIEVSETKWPNWSEMDQFWANNKDSMLWYMARSLVGIRGVVTDAQSGAPLSATADVTQVGKAIKTDPDVGDFHRMLEPGTYTLQVSAFGYQTQMIPGVVVVDGPAVRRDVQLARVPGYDVTGSVTDQDTGRPLTATVEARRYDTGDLIAQATTDAVTGAYSMALPGYTYDMKTSAPGHAPQTRRIILDRNRVEDFALLNSANMILVVTDGVTTHIPADLAALGFQTATETPAGTDPTTWPSYRLLVWSAGANQNPLADATKRAAVESYVAAGGKLLVEGGQIGYDVFRSPGYPSFGQNVLHCSAWDVSNAGAISIASGAVNHSLVTTPNTLPNQFTINYVDVGDEDAVRPRTEATLIYKTQTYPNDAGIVAYDDTPGDPERGQIVYYSFNYDKLADAANARHLLENTVHWLDRTSPADVAQDGPGRGAGARLVLGPAYPNPATREVRFRLDAAPVPSGSILAEVIDLQGRRVSDLSRSFTTDRLLTWDGRTSEGRAVPSGIYYLRVRTNGAERSRAFLWMKK